MLSPGCESCRRPPLALAAPRAYDGCEFVYQRTAISAAHNQADASITPVAMRKETFVNTNHLTPPLYQPLPLGQIQPQGWLKAQLELQANSLSGALDEFWPDIRDSGWFGGKAEGWERAPYWLDGVVPLAYVLDDERLQEKVVRYVDYILTHQQEDGWFGPVPQAGSAPDIWPQFLAVKMLVQYEDATADTRVIEAVTRNFRWLDAWIDRHPLHNWAQFRWFEALIGLYWLYARRPEPWLMDLAVKLHAQGFDWAAFFEDFPMTERTPTGRWNFMSHVVNNAMAVKAHGLWWQLSHDERDCAAIYNILEQHARYHGAVTGVITGDECLAGLSPTQGTELCAVVETMYSLEILLSILGDPAWGDHLERITFNALPATISPDMWSHQYDQQVNQVECSIHPQRNWTTNDPDANIFGLEPHFGCCTANFSQGWPKFAANLWMRTRDGGLAAMAYAPSAVACRIGDSDVHVNLTTDYPFRQTLHFEVTASAPVEFPLVLRIPAWANNASLQMPDGSLVYPQPGAFHTVERIWQGTEQLVLTLPMAARLQPRPQHTVALERGPLVYALKLEEDWRRIHADDPLRRLPHADWEIYPAGAWNYALALPADASQFDVTFTEHPLGELPFSPQGAPVSAVVKGCLLPQWEICNGSAGDLSAEVVACIGEPVDLTLIPYGCTNLRLTEFPVAPRP